MEKIRELYKITNEYSGLFYIGKSVDIYKRWITHKKDFENGTHSGGAFQYDYDVFGKEAFKFEIPDIVTPDDIFYHTESLI